MKYPSISYETFKLLGIPWQIDYESRSIKLLLKRIRKAQLKLKKKKDKLIGISFVPFLRSIHNKKNIKQVGLKELERQKNLCLGILWIEKNIKNKKSFNLRALLKVHAILTKAKEKSPRKTPVFLKDFHGNKLVEFPDPQYLQHLLDDFWAWKKNNQQLPCLLKALGLHFLISTIHPFKDGNGRLARLIEYDEIARNSSKDLSFYSSEFISCVFFNEYSKSISDSLRQNSMDPFIKFFLRKQVGLLENLARQT